MRSIIHDLLVTLREEKKMAFVAGPRQVGKTTLAQHLLKVTNTDQGYFNWDIPEHRQRILKDPSRFWIPEQGPMPSRIVLDEIHKYPRWKNFLKGFYDANRNQVETIVTGSGRLDIYQRGGDSLFGRYHLFHLDPYSVGELLAPTGRDLTPELCLKRIADTPPPGIEEAFEKLWRLTGFPQPLFQDDERGLVRWRQDRRQQVLREDLRDLTRVRELGLVEALLTLLPDRIGSPLSLNTLRIDLNVNFKTVQHWVAILERLYYLFSLRPYAARSARMLRREEKTYFYDWSELADPAKRFENMVAVHLLKACHSWTDAGFGDFRLHYVRDKEKREVDFLITMAAKPWLLIECKLSDRHFDKSLLYYHDHLHPTMAIQVVKEGDPSLFVQGEEKSILCSAARFLAALP